MTPRAGEHFPLTPGIYHSFRPSGAGAVIGKVSTTNDEAGDNIYFDKNLERFPTIEEGEPPVVTLVSD
jgi:hypothetical protein